MQRRAFVRIVGGGAVLAASGLGAGCSRQLPAEAIAAWQGPESQADLRRWMLGYAILAPHSHNLQSWLVDLSQPEQIVLYCDLKRLLPETDPFSRQIVMSQGTFLELLAMAARERGQRAEITLFPDGEFPAAGPDERPVARIRLQPDASVARDPLFAQVLQRHTNRNAYEAQREVPAAAWQAMAEAAAPYGLRFGHAGLAQPEQLQQQREVAADAWRIELVTPRTILESYRVLRVGGREIAEHRDGIALTDPMVVWLNRLGLFDRSKAPGPDDFATKSQIEDFNAKLQTTPAFMWMVSADNTRATQIDAGRAYVRVQLAATAHGLAMHPLQQALQEYPEQAGPYRRIRQLLGAQDAPQTVQMWARVGYAAPVQPAPRRGVQAHILRA
jgi:hypothetical protein